MELGINRFLFSGPNSPSGAGTNPVPDLMEEIEFADRAAVDVFQIGEHHTDEFADSSPAVLLAAAAARTSRIRLSSGITILGVADPVRVMEDFATLDLVSEGRAEMVVGRGAYAEAFSLFGCDLVHYDELFAEKLDLLLRLRSGAPVHWRGRYRPALDAAVTYPRPVQPLLPIWLGATQSPESFIRAGQLGLPLALGVIGGSYARLRPLTDLYRQAGRNAGHAEEQLKISVHAIGYIGETSAQARTDFFPSYNVVFGELGRKASWPELTRGRFDAMTAPGEALIIGDAAEVTAKIRHINAVLGGVSRICLQMTVGPLSRRRRLDTIGRLGAISARSLASHE
jgi:alkanesulfonate monooxygenase SsuD/methylene tetrahydromethanopterin reductase-like flavin-dependent oxidoreductase (luciferase family)